MFLMVRQRKGKASYFFDIPLIKIHPSEIRMKKSREKRQTRPITKHGAIELIDI